MEDVTCCNSKHQIKGKIQHTNIQGMKAKTLYKHRGKES